MQFYVTAPFFCLSVLQEISLMEFNLCKILAIRLSVLVILCTV